jgi:hypothetical protein
MTKFWMEVSLRRLGRLSVWSISSAHARTHQLPSPYTYTYPRVQVVTKVRELVIGGRMHAVGLLQTRRTINYATEASFERTPMTVPGRHHGAGRPSALLHHGVLLRGARLVLPHVPGHSIESDRSIACWQFCSIDLQMRSIGRFELTNAPAADRSTDSRQSYTTFYPPPSQVAPKLHGLRVRKVQEQVKRWNEAGLRGKKTMCTARASWLTMSTRTATFKEVRVLVVVCLAAASCLD